jgi:hypothetical protein
MPWDKDTERILKEIRGEDVEEEQTDYEPDAIMNVSLDQETIDRIDILAENHGLSKSGVIRVVINKLHSTVKEENQRPVGDPYPESDGMQRQYHVKPKQKRWLKKKCDEWGYSMSEVIRFCVLYYGFDSDDESAGGLSSLLPWK